MKITYEMIEEAIKKGCIKVENFPVDGSLVCTIADDEFCFVDELAWRPAEDCTKEFEIKFIATIIYEVIESGASNDYQKYWNFLLKNNIGVKNIPSINTILEDVITRCTPTKQKHPSNHQSTTDSETDGSPDNGNIQIGGHEMEEDLDL